MKFWRFWIFRKIGIWCPIRVHLSNIASGVKNKFFHSWVTQGTKNSRKAIQTNGLSRLQSTVSYNQQSTISQILLKILTNSILWDATFFLCYEKKSCKVIFTWLPHRVRFRAQLPLWRSQNRWTCIFIEKAVSNFFFSVNREQTSCAVLYRGVPFEERGNCRQDSLRDADTLSPWEKPKWHTGFDPLCHGHVRGQRLQHIHLRHGVAARSLYLPRNTDAYLKRLPCESLILICWTRVTPVRILVTNVVVNFPYP